MRETSQDREAEAPSRSGFSADTTASLFPFLPTKQTNQSLRVTAIEAERLEGEREQRKLFERQLRAEVQRQAREKGVVVKLPPPNPSSNEE